MAAALTNGAMMGGIPPSEVKAITWWEYQGLLWNWNDRHKLPDDAEPAETPDAGFVMKRQAQLERSGIAQVLH